jgi:hypothetical protein
MRKRFALTILTLPPLMPVEGWKLTKVCTTPVSTPMAQDEMSDVAMVEDLYYAKVYLNRFVWHDDLHKTAEYRAANEVTQLHYCKCAEIRVFSGLQQVIKPIHRFFLGARAAGEDL